jgi:hypothetical protein
MANRISDFSGLSVSTLICGIVSDLQALFQQELALAKREVADEIVHGKKAAIIAGYRDRSRCHRRASSVFYVCAPPAVGFSRIPSALGLFRNRRSCDGTCWKRDHSRREEASWLSPSARTND